MPGTFPGVSRQSDLIDYADHLPRGAHWFYYEALTVVGAGAIGILYQANPHSLIGELGGNNGSANGDEWQLPGKLLAAGSYNLHVAASRFSGFGQVTLYIKRVGDAGWTTLGVVDEYVAGGPTHEYYPAAMPFTIGKGGRYIVRGVTTGKNASSSGFRTWFTGFWIKPTTAE